MGFGKGLHRRMHRNAHEHSVGCGGNAVGREAHQHSKVFYADGNGYLEVEVGRCAAGNGHPLDGRAQHGGAVTVGSVENAYLQGAVDVAHEAAGKADADVPDVAFIEELRLHEADFDRYCDHHLAAQGSVAHARIVREHLYVIGGKLVGIGEAEGNVSGLVAPEERLPGEGGGEVFADHDVGGNLFGGGGSGGHVTNCGLFFHHRFRRRGIHCHHVHRGGFGHKTHIPAQAVEGHVVRGTGILSADGVEIHAWPWPVLSCEGAPGIAHEAFGALVEHGHGHFGAGQSLDIEGILRAGRCGVEEAL